MTTTINASTSSGLVNTADTSGILQLQTANTAAVTIDASQNVGVGTTDMSVSGANAKFAVSGGVLNLDDSYAITWGGGTGRPSVNGNKASQYILINTNGSERMRIDSSGNVGIGTSSPIYKLQVGAFSGNNTLLIAAGTSGESSLFFGDGSTGTDPYRGYLQYQHTSDTLLFATNATASMRMDGSGRVLVGLTSANTSGSNFQVSQGITFPATQSASSDANTLDDYEEGSWTPTDASGAGLSITVNSARYTKIGRVVHVTFYISYPSTASAAQISIGGLPFTSSGGEVYCTGSLSTNAAITGFTRIGPSATTVQVFAISGSTSITNTQIAPNYAITSITYITST